MRIIAVLLLVTTSGVYAGQQSEKSGSAGVNSESQKTNVPKSGSGAVASRAAAGYVLGPGDQISIRVVNFEEINDKPIPIDLSGRIHLPLVGDVQVSGITIQQLESELSRRLKKYVLNPDVSISVTDFRSQPVSVVGAVRTPGVQQVQGRKTVLEVLSMAGGLEPLSAGSTLKITRQKEWGPIPLPNAETDPTQQYSVAQINLKSLIDAKHPEENIEVKPNDVISVPRADTVYVLGEVQKAGGYVLTDTDAMSVLQALSMAGGLSQMAKARESRILRRQPGSVSRDEIPVDLTKMLAGRSSDVRLLPEDILFVPNNIPKRAAIRAIEAGVNIGSGIAVFRRP